MSNAENIKALEDAKKILDTSAQANRNLFIMFNIVLITVLILCLSITDKMLLIGLSPIKTPLFNIDVPMWAFASITPLALVALHFDLLQNLNAHRDKLITWCRYWLKVHPETLNNSTMPKQLYPFLFDFAWVYNNHVEPKTAGIRMLPHLCWLLYCWSTYTVLIIFFVRFADLQHYGYSTWHLALIIFDALLLHWYWLGFSTQAKPAAWQFVLAVLFAPVTFVPWFGKKILNHLKTSRIKLILLWFSNAVLAWTLTLFTAIQLYIDFDTSPELVNKVVAWEGRNYRYLGLHLVPRLTVPFFRPTLPDQFLAIEKLQQPDKSESQLWHDNETPILNLSKRRFAFADFSWSILPHTYFVHTNLQSANLSEANLEASDFTGANLQSASFGGTNLRAASFEHTKLQGALLIGSNLQAAYFDGANLQAVQLDGVNAQAAFFCELTYNGHIYRLCMMS